MNVLARTLFLVAVAALAALPCPTAYAANKENWHCAFAHFTLPVQWATEIKMQEYCIADVSNEDNVDYFQCTFMPDGDPTEVDDTATSKTYQHNWKAINGVGPVYCSQGGRGSHILEEKVCKAPYHWDNSVQGCVAPPDPDPDTYDDEEELGRCEVCQGMRGNPVNVATGNNFYIETDYTGAGSFPLVLQRFYNSSDFVTSGRLGLNWRHSYDRAIVASGATTVKAIRADGKVYRFTYDGTNWVAAADVVDRLVELTSDDQRTGWTYTAADNSVEQYNAAGLLTGITNVNGLQQTLTYDLSTGSGGDGINNTLDRVTSFGRNLNFTYDSQGRLTTIKDPAGKNYLYGHDSSNRLTSVTYPDDSVDPDSERTFQYDPSTPYLLTGVTDENGNVFMKWTYDGSGRTRTEKQFADTQQTVEVNALTFTYNTDGTTKVANGFGAEQTYSFIGVLGNLRNTAIAGAKCQDCGQEYKEIRYDAGGFIIATEDFAGNVTTYQRDARGLETLRTEGQAGPIDSPTPTGVRTITTSWHETYRLPELITEEGKTTNPTYETGSPRLKNRIEKDSVTGATRTTAFTYQNGLLKTVNGPRTDLSDITTYAYDAAGNVATITNALNRVTTFNTYDAYGRPTQVTDPNGNITVLAYDARGRLTSRTLAYGTGSAATTEFEYDKAGNLTTLFLPGSAAIAYTYDAAHRLTAIRDNLNNLICYTLDNMGNRTQEKFYANATDCDNPGSAPVRTLGRQYDPQNRLIRLTGGEGQVTTFEYDGNGHRKKVIVDPDGLNQVTEYFYDPLNRLEKVHAPVVDGVTPVTLFAYDARDNLTSVTDPENLETTYKYDGLDNLTEQVSPDTRTTAWTYDAAGNRLTQTDARNVVVNYAHDALNRPISVDYSNNALDVTFAYDACVNGVGRVCSMTDDAGMTTYAYNRRGVVNKQTVTIDSVVRTLSYQYDAADRPTRITYPSGRAVDFWRDAAGVVDSVTVLDGTVTQTLASNVGYLPFGPLSGLTFGSGIQMSRGYDLDYRLETLRDIGTATLQDLTYGYSPAGNVETITDHLDGSRTQSFGYDALDRLTSASAPQGYGSQAFTYDRNGNRQSALVTGQATADDYLYAYEQGTGVPSNRLLEITNNGSPVQTFGWDNTGNTKTTSSLTFTYAQHNRPSQVAVTASGSVLGTYTYNGRGERVKTAVTQPATTTTLFFYGPDGQLLAETDGAGVNRREYVYLDTLPLALLDGTSLAIRYVHSDHLGTPQRLTNSQQAIVWSATYEPFGKATVSGSVTNNLRFPGQYFSAETGFHYNYFRDYDPKTARYLQSDPIGLRAGTNTFVYVRSNPLALIDPQGLRDASWITEELAREFVASAYEGGAGLLAGIKCAQRFCLLGIRPRESDQDDAILTECLGLLGQPDSIFASGKLFNCTDSCKGLINLPKFNEYCIEMYSCGFRNPQS